MPRAERRERSRLPVRYRVRFVQQAFRKHHRKTQVQSCAPLQPITVPLQPVTTEFGWRRHRR